MILVCVVALAAAMAIRFEILANKFDDWNVEGRVLLHTRLLRLFTGDRMPPRFAAGGAGDICRFFATGGDRRPLGECRRCGGSGDGDRLP